MIKKKTSRKSIYEDKTKTNENKHRKRNTSKANTKQPMLNLTTPKGKQLPPHV